MPRLHKGTRIQLICPAGNLNLRRATDDIIVYLRGLQTVQRWGGLTYSRPRSPVFRGEFWSVPKGSPPVEGSWVQDQNIVIVIDAPGWSANDLSFFLAGVHDRAAEIYRQRGEEQETLWITTQAIHIFERS